MIPLIIGLAVFFAIHLVPTNPQLRSGLSERFGETGYKAIFSVLSIAGLALIVYGYHKVQVHTGKAVPLWDPPVWTAHVAATLMLPAMILLVAAYVPSRIRTAARHPMLVSIKLWALAHLVANGTLADLLLFGSFLAYAVYDRISVKARGALGPLGETRGGLAGDLTAVGVGTALYAALLLGGHYWLFGKAPLPALSFAP